MLRLILWLRSPNNRLWVKPALGCLLAVAIALAAAAGNRLIEPGTLPAIEAETLDDLLTVIASSMLAVSTFSLSIMVAAFATASRSATPRASDLVMGDEGTHIAITSFISSFIYSIVAKTALGLGYYGETGRFLLFVATMGFLIFLVITLLRWVRTMSSLGLMGNTLEKIERAAAEAMRDYRRSPGMGATMHVSPPDDAPLQRITADRVGYLQHLDMPLLQEIAERHELEVFVRQRAGAFVLRDTEVLEVRGRGSPPDPPVWREALVIGSTRSYRQDPRFGLIVLSEVAQRALSPAMNDPGTAIAVMNTMVRVLTEALPGESEPPPERLDRVAIVPIDEADFVFQGFDPIARDGASISEVQWRMQKLLAGLARADVSPAIVVAARQQAVIALERAENALPLPRDVQGLRNVHASLHPAP